MKTLIFVLGLTVIFSNANASPRDQMKIVGSSTVYPFSSYVAEEFGSVSRYPTPVVESTGTGGGMKLFCSDNSLNSPDIANASRRMKIKEFNLCERNGVKNITEAMFGYDGIVLAQSEKNKPLNISKKELLLALIKLVPNEKQDKLIDNPYQFWDQINSNLPHRKISIYGPPASSGTRDAFEEMVFEYQTDEIKVYRDAGLKGYRIIRTDGVYIPSGENDNLIVKKLSKDTAALGIFGYSFLTENSDTISGVTIEGIQPTAKNIATKQYPISRSLFFYIKNDHTKDVPAIKEYIEMFLNVDLIGEDGLLAEIGLIPLTDQEIKQSHERTSKYQKLTLNELKKNHGF
ncbi:MAG: substrate-binding domain-containing protein [Gammaproteobacteria bacterium]|nr:substrate-binding domain-containing protein [Gammaproteobacteria bacterium]